MPNIQSAPGESRVEQRMARRKCRRRRVARGESHPRIQLHVQTLHAEVHRSVGEPAEGSLPRVASKPRPLTVTKTLGGVAQQCVISRPPVPLSPPTRQHRSVYCIRPPLDTPERVRRFSAPLPPKTSKTFGNGYLGSCDDEERSEMRYVMRTAERESSNL